MLDDTTQANASMAKKDQKEVPKDRSTDSFFFLKNMGELGLISSSFAASPTNAWECNTCGISALWL